MRATLEQRRATARAYERELPAGRRKRLGQYFTGLLLGRLLAHLALVPETRTVLDPMAGHGDLLDAAWEAAGQRGISLTRLDGVEVDAAAAAVCRQRLAHVTGAGPAPVRQIVVTGDAFAPATIEALPQTTYDLVIANPPYVRYQLRRHDGAGVPAIRSGLRATVTRIRSGADAFVWRELAESYSGLADLSVPAWLLAAALVRPGGRLALVVPATWRSRDYADIVRYLMLRCFDVKCIVTDRQPGWFSDALVRTNLIVAERCSGTASARPLGERTWQAAPPWVEIAPEAAGAGSLVGAVARRGQAEAAFATRLYTGSLGDTPNVAVRRFGLEGEAAAVRQRASRRRWFRSLEKDAVGLSPCTNARTVAAAGVPDVFTDLLSGNMARDALTSLADAGISVGQGLRTGCNEFFYVTACGSTHAGDVLVESSRSFDHRRFIVPASAVHPVLRRQAEVAQVDNGQMPAGRVLDLRAWVLPADVDSVQAAHGSYVLNGEPVPDVMPEALARHVRKATVTAAGAAANGTLIPALSAVRTNVRLPRDGRTTPRFWYMLPEFAPRHRPAVFVPRVNHRLPRAGANLDPPLLVDANFSTFWAVRGDWTRDGLNALLNSIWCRASMEALGTPLGGGALKLEATQLRNMVIPDPSEQMKRELDDAGRQLVRSPAAQARVDAIVLGAVVARMGRPIPVHRLAEALEQRAAAMSASRTGSP